VGWRLKEIATEGCLVGGIDEAVETFGGVGGYRQQPDVINGDQVSAQHPGDGLGDGVIGAVAAQQDREALQVGNHATHRRVWSRPDAVERDHDLVGVEADVLCGGNTFR